MSKNYRELNVSDYVVQSLLAGPVVNGLDIAVIKDDSARIMAITTSAVNSWVVEYVLYARYANNNALEVHEADPASKLNGIIVM